MDKEIYRPRQFYLKTAACPKPRVEENIEKAAYCVTRMEKAAFSALRMCRISSATFTAPSFQRHRSGAKHEGDILLHQAAKKAFDELGVKKLPTVKSLQTEYAALLENKKKAYAEYRAARDEMRELLTHKANVERLLGKEQEAEKDAERKKEPNR